VNNDLISREALKEALHNFFDGKVIDEPTYILRDVFCCIDNATAVEPTRPQGKWIMQRHDLDGCFYTCSICGRMIRVPLFIDDPEDNETLADYPFCHCGAEMKGGAE
jgi:hypothetical protein